MKAVNFVPSNSSMRERQMLATPAGFFCFQQKGFKPYDKRPAITEPQREVTLAQADCWTAVFGGPRFFPPTNVQQYALPHRNQISRRPAAHQIPHYYPCQVAQAGGRNGAPITRPAHRTRFAFAGNKEAAFSSIISCNSVT